MSDIEKNIHRVAAILESAFTKEMLFEHYYNRSKQFVDDQIKLLLKDGFTKEILAALKIKNPPKSKIALLCAIPLSSKAYYELFLAQFPPEIQQIWHELIWHEQLHQKEIEAKFGIKIYVPVQKSLSGRRAFTENELRPEFIMFSRNQHYHHHYYYSTAEREYILSLPLPLRQHLAAYYEHPADARLTPVKQPDPTQRTCLNGEQSILLELPRLQTYRDQGQIAYTTKGRPVHTTLVKMRRSLNLQEFFPDHADKKIKTLRTAQLAGLINCISKKHVGPPQHILRNFFTSQYLNTRTAPIVLADLKGMGYIDDYYFLQAEEAMLSILKALPAGEWISIENIKQYIKYNLIYLRPIARSTAEDKLYYQYEEQKGGYRHDQHYISEDLYYRAVEVSFLLGSFFLFAALGLCDIAYDEPDPEQLGRTQFSSWDGLRYVRRTPLGDYAGQLTDAYDASGFTGGTKITLSPDTLMITTDEADTGISAILEPYAERLGASRFRVDSQVFLKNIHTKKELDTKITLFKQIVGDNMPPNWQAFFKDILNKINPFESVGDWMLYKIPADNKALIQLAAQDPVLKEIVVKAEKFIILVPKDRVALFKRRLQEFGYLLT